MEQEEVIDELLSAISVRTTLYLIVVWRTTNVKLRSPQEKLLRVNSWGWHGSEGEVQSMLGAGNSRRNSNAAFNKPPPLVQHHHQSLPSFDSQSIRNSNLKSKNQNSTSRHHWCSTTTKSWSKFPKLRSPTNKKSKIWNLKSKNPNLKTHHHWSSTTSPLVNKSQVESLNQLEIQNLKSKNPNSTSRYQQKQHQQKAFFCQQIPTRQV